MIDFDRLFCQECGRFLACIHTMIILEEFEIHLLGKILEQDGYCFVSMSMPEGLPDAFQAGSSFFHQSIEFKLKSLSIDRARRGYSPLYTDNFASLTGHQKPNDSVEKFRVGPLMEGISPEELANEYNTCKEGKIHFFPNIWPVLPGFQQAVTNYYRYMEELAVRMLRLLEVVLNLPSTSLTGSMVRHTSIMGLNAYLPLPSSTSYQPERVAEHTDVSLFTIVHDFCESANGPNLQMYSYQQQAWIDIILSANTFLVNIGMHRSSTFLYCTTLLTIHFYNFFCLGECLQHWSGNKVTAARHRVLQGEDRNAERLSIAYFCTPAYTTQLLWPGVESDESSSHAVSVSYSIWRKQKIKRTLQCIKQSKGST
jgi:isopenicillin N synthase-like dioxygenase